MTVSWSGTGGLLTGHADEDDLLALPLLASVILLRTTTGRGIGVGDRSPSGAKLAETGP